jgi:iron complex transport system ATP-binding protein
MEAIVIRASSISLLRGDREILRDFNLEISAGRTLAIIGPNGSGKSTLISALVGDLSPSKGEITINQRPIHEYSLSELATIRSVASQQQRFSLAYKVEDVLMMAITFSGDQESILRAVDALDIKHLVTRKVTSLSGGEQQRVSIAMALAQKSQHLFLDEPFSAQDLESTERITKHLRQLASEGVAVVVVAHMSERELAWCDERIELKRI